MAKRTGMMMDPELLALEAEVCGGGTMTSLGAVSSYHVKGDDAIALSTLNNMVSCQSGGMYERDATKDVTFKQSERNVARDSGTSYRLITHKTNNKDAEMTACSISVFNGNNFVAYLFSTNDPLAFDNFNCFRGDAALDDKRIKPKHKSVEQMVFCENKVQINLTYVESLTPKLFLKAAKNAPFFGFKNFLKVLNIQEQYVQPALKESIETINATYQKALDRFKQTLDPANVPDANARKRQIQTEERRLLNTAKDDLVAVLAANSAHARLFYDSYLTYFKRKLNQRHDLIPFDHYKSVGRDLCAVGEYINIFDRYSLLCAMSARMTQLRGSAPERFLVSALVPDCVVECSKDDGTWGYIVNPEGEEKLGWLAEGRNDDRLFAIINDATTFQAAYIKQLSEHISNNKFNEAADFLFASPKEIIAFRASCGLSTCHKKDANVHRLGLSERLIQSLWTKELSFPDTLINDITCRLQHYGITYDHYVPELVKQASENANPLGILQSIGRPI